MQDTKKNVFDKKEELRYYAKFPMFNYGFIPRTWEQTLTKDENGLYVLRFIVRETTIRLIFVT